MGGAIVDSCLPSNAYPEMCGDGLDNDCDGVVDNRPGEVAVDLKFSNQTTLIWTASYQVDTYSLYRGSISIYGPWTFNQTCFAGPLSGAAAVDTQNPPSDALFFYLVTGRNGCGDGTPGFASNGAQRPTAIPCP